MLAFYVKALFILVCVGLLMACAHSVKEAVLMPPLRLDKAISSVSVKNFSGKHGDQLSEKIKGQIKAEGYISVLKENADAILSGELVLSDIENHDYSRTYEVEREKNGNKYTTTETAYYATKRCSGTATYSLNNGNILLAGYSHNAEFNEEKYGSSNSEASSNLPTDQAIISGLLSDLSNKILLDISPHKETFSFELQTGGLWGGDDRLKMGADYYEKGMYGQAEGYWKMVISDPVNATPENAKHVAAAYYNLGVLQMHNSNHAEAFKMFREADAKQPGNSTYMEALQKAELAGSKAEEISSRGFNNPISKNKKNRIIKKKKNKKNRITKKKR